MYYKKIVLLFLCCYGLHLLSYDFIDITQLGFEQYQDIIVNNQIIKPASGKRRDCQGRYKIIQEVLNRFNRPFTMVDLGASQGYYSFRTAVDYDTVCVMIDGNNKAYPKTGDQLLDLCRLNALPNIIFLNKPLTVEDIRKLGNCEHFDVVLALNVIHWFPDCWKEMADAILNLGDFIIIETPPQEQFARETIDTVKNNKIRKDIETYLIARGAVALGRVMRHTTNTFATIYLIHRPRTTLVNRSWLHTKPGINKHLISSSLDDKTLTKINTVSKKELTSEWVPGINLITFKLYKGAYPSLSTLTQALTRIRDCSHPDWMPNNMIVQGNTLHLIDYVREDIIFPYSERKEKEIVQWLYKMDSKQLAASYPHLASFK